MPDLNSNLCWCMTINSYESGYYQPECYGSRKNGQERRLPAKILDYGRPPTSPTTAPPENVELNIGWLIASFFSGWTPLMMPKAMGNIAIPTPCAILAVSMNSMLVANRPAIIISNIFFLQ